MKVLFSLLALCAPVLLLYGQFFWNPVVFDDINFFDGLVHERYLDWRLMLNLRWLPYASFEWTRELLGLELIWFRLGNLALHLATVISLFLFLRRLFGLISPDDQETLSPHWLAFFAALIFALHPASVYAVGYLIQRTMLMATLFALLTWRLFLEGLIREQRGWLLASAVTYFLAVLSKEHAIMVPAIAMALLLLVNNRPIRERLMLVWPALVLYGLIGGFVLFQIKSSHLIGQAYEPNTSNFELLLGPDFNADFVYPLSVLTQAFLFFKYLWVWLVPSPAWMSVDMPQAFARSFWSWPQTAGLIGFVVYPILAVRLLLQQGLKGLLGFALLCPWLLFATELSSVRIQEAFVLYRSYIWMAGFFVALPFLMQKLSKKQAAVVLTFVALSMLPLSWLRLMSFSHPLLVWDDAVRQVENTDEGQLRVATRLYYGRGREFFKVKRYNEAINDFSKAIQLQGPYAGFSYYSRASAHMEIREYQKALADVNKAIELVPNEAKFHMGKASVLEALNESSAAMKAYKQACSLGMSSACKKAGQAE